MAKKINSSFSKSSLFAVLSILLIAAAIGMFALPFICYKNTVELLGISSTVERTWNGFACVFKAGIPTVSTTNLSNSVTTSVDEVGYVVPTTTVIAFFLLVIGFVVEALSFVSMPKFKAVVLGLGAVVLLAAGVLTFFNLGNFLDANGIVEESVELYSLGTGTILAGALGCLGGLSSVAGIVIK